MDSVDSSRSARSHRDSSPLREETRESESNRRRRSSREHHHDLSTSRKRSYSEHEHRHHAPDRISHSSSPPRSRSRDGYAEGRRHVSEYGGSSHRVGECREREYPIVETPKHIQKFVRQDLMYRDRRWYDGGVQPRQHVIAAGGVGAVRFDPSEGRDFQPPFPAGTPPVLPEDEMEHLNSIDTYCNLNLVDLNIKDGDCESVSDHGEKRSLSSLNSESVESFFSDILKKENPWSVFENIHTVQYSLYNGTRPPIYGSLDRVLRGDSPRCPYRSRAAEIKSAIHWGQRKLLMSEIEFLTLFGYPGATVVYAGAAPGSHTNYLSDLFPDLNFVLVDPAPFIARETNRVRIWQTFFTDEMARKFAGQNVLFISDIRSANPESLDRDEVEEYVNEDMEAQARWHKLMEPHKSMLKFRLPWEKGSRKKYLDGLVFLPVWGCKTTTECRLVPTSGEKEWDCTLYEEQLFYFNTITRVSYYPHDVVSGELDFCYDCASEVFILKNFLRSHLHAWKLCSISDALEWKEKNIVQFEKCLTLETARMVEEISVAISDGSNNLNSRISGHRLPPEVVKLVREAESIVSSPVPRSHEQIVVRILSSFGLEPINNRGDDVSFLRAVSGMLSEPIDDLRSLQQQVVEFVRHHEDLLYSVLLPSSDRWLRRYRNRFERIRGDTWSFAWSAFSNRVVFYISHEDLIFRVRKIIPTKNLEEMQPLIVCHLVGSKEVQCILRDSDSSATHIDDFESSLRNAVKNFSEHYIEF